MRIRPAGAMLTRDQDGVSGIARELIGCGPGGCKRDTTRWALGRSSSRLQAIWQSDKTNLTRKDQWNQCRDGASHSRRVKLGGRAQAPARGGGVAKRTQRENASDFNAGPDDSRELSSSCTRLDAAAASGGFGRTNPIGSRMVFGGGRAAGDHTGPRCPPAFAGVNRGYGPSWQNEARKRNDSSRGAPQAVT